MIFFVIIDFYSISAVGYNFTDSPYEYQINFCEDLANQCDGKDPSQFQARSKDPKPSCIRLAGSAVKSQNKFYYLSKILKI